MISQNFVSVLGPIAILFCPYFLKKKFSRNELIGIVTTFGIFDTSKYFVFTGIGFIVGKNLDDKDKQKNN
ncbi:MAG TPA: hypothetical protein ENI76_08580 [Ignavibacteria bacterium]|nr:hypothetical protein [Ignavibacteria bacterium]